MKFSITHALIGVAVLAVAIKLSKGKKATAAKPENGPITGQAQWWTYAGSWNVPTV